MRSRESPRYSQVRLAVTIVLLSSLRPSLRISQQNRDCLQSIEGIKINICLAALVSLKKFSKNDVLDGTFQTRGPGFQPASPHKPVSLTAWFFYKNV